MAGEQHIPDNIQQLQFVSDSDVTKQVPTQNTSLIKEEHVISPHQALAAVDNGEFDIRPRFFDKLSKAWILLDTGAQVSCSPPSSTDVPDPTLAVEAVNGSIMPCYGRRQQTFQSGRKQYHQLMTVTNTTETILGMDFIKRYRIDLRWGEFGDYFMYDTIAKISTPLQFVKIPKGILPAISRVAKISRITDTTDQILQSSPWEAFQVAAIQSIQSVHPVEQSQAEALQSLPEKYKKLISEHPSILKADFRNVKHSVEHSIDTTGAPVRCKARPLLPGSPKAVAGKKAWDEMVSLGIVERVDPNEAHYYSSPLHLQDKPDGSQRPCGDFRALNDQTLQDSYNLPNLNHFSASIKKSKYFSKIDLSKAFHFIPIKLSDQNKTCVATPWGLYKFKRLAFGLKNAPMSFCKFIGEVLHGIDHVYAYLDDFLVFTEDEETHYKVVEEIFKRLEKFGLAIALPKCKFAAEEVEFLGYKVNKSGITPLAYKLEAIDKCPVPTTQNYS